MREAGVLMPVASLPGAYGVGELGASCDAFVDWLVQAGASVWQILPLNPLGYGNSPYQPFSSYAGDSLYISLELLHREGLLEELPAPFRAEAAQIDYTAVRAYKEPFLRRAYQNFTPDAEYRRFAAQEWVYPYAVFRALKAQNGQRCWLDWPAEQKAWIKNRRYDLGGLEDEIGFEMFIQYRFVRQWRRVKDYANGRGIRIMGDIPFYVGIDSLDVWANQEEFLLDADGHPTFIAGVPPDCFSAEGQRWGNPIYDWTHMEGNGFRFWVDRLRYCAGLFDIVRIDHFRAFDTYWKIPASCPTAMQGEWVQAPGYRLFDTLLQVLPDLELVAEDLGADRESVYELRDHYGFKGMKLMQFQDPFLEPGAPAAQPLLPPRAQMAAYTGTHDNQTVLGWYQGMDRRQQSAWQGYLQALGVGDGREETFPAAICRWTLADKADLAVLPMQDILGLGEAARLNAPGTLGSPNWEWRLPTLAGTETARAAFAADLARYGRAPSGRFYHPCEADPCLLLQTLLAHRFGTAVQDAGDAQLYAALLETVKLLALNRESQDAGKRAGGVSAEFPHGRTLTDNLLNLGAYEPISGLLHAHGRELAALEEREASPGNGGLG